MVSFLIKGPMAEPYKVEIYKEKDIIKSTCTCQPYQNDICKHIINILNGNTQNIISNNLGDLHQVAEMIEGTDYLYNFNEYKKWNLRGHDFLIRTFLKKMVKKSSFDPYIETDTSKYYRDNFIYKRVKYNSGCKRTVGKDDKYYFYKLYNDGTWGRINEFSFDEHYYDNINDLKNIKISPLDGKVMSFEFDGFYNTEEKKEVNEIPSQWKKTKPRSENNKKLKFRPSLVKNLHYIFIAFLVMFSITGFIALKDSNDKTEDYSMVIFIVLFIYLIGTGIWKMIKFLKLKIFKVTLKQNYGPKRTN